MFKPKYFKGRISQGFVAIYSARMILRISTALIGLFLPIFLYELFNLKFQYVIYYYFIGHLLYGLTVAWGSKYLNKVGLRRSIRISVVLGAVYYFIFYLLDQAAEGADWSFLPANKITILLILAIITLTFYRTMYWIPLHTDLAKFTNKRNRAKQLSVMEATTLALYAVMPIVAGWILIHYSYDILFFIGICIYLISLAPLIFLPRTRERFSWTYLQTWKELFSRKRRKAVLAFVGAGAEDVVGVVIWPIFIWELLAGNYFEVGALSSLVVVVTMVLQLIFGRFTDLSNKQKMLKLGNVFYAVGWIVKIFIATAFQIFIASTYHNLTKIFARTPFDALTYEKAADQGHYVDEYTVIHEMSIQFGKCLMLVFVLLLLPFFSVQWAFIFAAAASLVMNYLADEEAVSGGRHAG